MAVGDDFERFRGYLHVIAEASIGPRLRVKVAPSDLVQETLLKAHAARDGRHAKDDAAIAAYLRRILANTIKNAQRDHLRARRDIRRERSIEEALVRSSASLEKWTADRLKTPSQQIERWELVERLADALMRLPASQRLAVTLHHWQGKKLEEIARTMDRSIPAVANLIYRGLRSLRVDLDGLLS